MHERIICDIWYFNFASITGLVREPEWIYRLRWGFRNGLVFWKKNAYYIITINNLKIQSHDLYLWNCCNLSSAVHRQVRCSPGSWLCFARCLSWVGTSGQSQTSETPFLRAELQPGSPMRELQLNRMQHGLGPRNLIEHDQNPSYTATRAIGDPYSITTDS